VDALHVYEPLVVVALVSLKKLRAGTAWSEAKRMSLSVAANQIAACAPARLAAALCRRAVVLAWLPALAWGLLGIAASMGDAVLARIDTLLVRLLARLLRRPDILTDKQTLLSAARRSWLGRLWPLRILVSRFDFAAALLVVLFSRRGSHSKPPAVPPPAVPHKRLEATTRTEVIAEPPLVVPQTQRSPDVVVECKSPPAAETASEQQEANKKPQKPEQQMRDRQKNYHKSKKKGHKRH